MKNNFRNLVIGLSILGSCAANAQLSANIGVVGYAGPVTETFSVEFIDPVTQWPLSNPTVNLTGWNTFSFNNVPIPTSQWGSTVGVLVHTQGSLRAGTVIPVSSTGTGNINVNLILGDSDGDNEVNIGDYSRTMFYWLWSGVPEDLNLDGIVDIADYALLSFNYGLAGDYI